MDIDWPPFQAGDRLLDHPATENDMVLRRAAFMVRDEEGRAIGSTLHFGMPRLGRCLKAQERGLGVMIQAESAYGQSTVGIRHKDGSYTVCQAIEFKPVPRFTVFYRKAGFGLKELEQTLASYTHSNRELTLATRNDVLAVRWGDGVPLFVRHTSGDPVAHEMAFLRHLHPEYVHISKFAEWPRCDSMFEVSILDLEGALKARSAIVALRLACASRLAGGFEYLEWRGELMILGPKS